MEKSPPAAVLGETLLRQFPGCAFLLRPGLAFEAVYGAAPRIFGRSAAELEKLTFTDLFDPPARPAWTGRLERVFAGETVSAAARFAATAPAYAITLFPVALPGGPAFAGGSAHEIAGRDLVLRSLDALDAARARLAQFLHDHIGQNLSAAGLQLDLLRMDLAQAAVPAVQRIAEIQTTLENLMQSVRDFNREFNPALAERIGLRAALDALAGHLRSAFPGRIRLLADATAQPPPSAAGALYRIAQEAAAQAMRRAGCSEIQILLKSSRTGPALEIRDNAPGVDPFCGAAHGPEFAYWAMQYHADRAGLELQIDAAPDAGTVVRVSCRHAH